MCNNVRLGPRPETQEEVDLKVKNFIKLMERELLKMSATIRCKFICESKREYLSQGPTFDYVFRAVYGDSPENKEFFKWTPAGSINVATVKNDSFVIGKEYYVDFTIVN